MQTEIEAKFTDIDIDRMREKLSKAGAMLTHPERLMKRKMFDYEDDRLNKIHNGWIRVRDEGDKVTLSYKELRDRSLHGTKEISVIVDGFDNTCYFFEAIGLKARAYQETKRESWSLMECEVTIDTWPWIPPFVEIEGPTERAVRAVASALELDWDEAMYGSVETVYQQHYAVTEEEIDHWPSITFVPVPEWLERVRKGTSESL
jgi:adenylate cyclase class 2